MRGLGDFNRPFRTQDLKDLHLRATVHGMRHLVDELRGRGLATTSKGRLDMTNLTEVPSLYSNSIHNLRAWEYSRIYDLCGIEKGMRVLDCGGASSPLVFYMAKMGVEVTTVDLQEDPVENTLKVASAMGWRITARVMDLTQMDFPNDSFDRVVSISVLEHMDDELKVKGIREFARVVRPGGLVGISFDYGQGVWEGHRPIRSIEDIHQFFVEPSGLSIYGNEPWDTNPLETDVAFLKEMARYEPKVGHPIRRFVRALRRGFHFDSPYLYYTVFTLFLQKI